jgi:CRP-like cAMP-binding protein
VITAVESELERELSASIMRGEKQPKPSRLKEGDALVEQGDPGDTLFLLLDGMLAVEIDGEQVAQVGPGAILGEQAVLEGGERTATLRAMTPCKVITVAGDEIDPDALAEVARGRE